MNVGAWSDDLNKISRGASKEIRAVLADAQARGGWVGRRLKSGHIRIRYRDGTALTVATSTASFRTVYNARADIRRVEGRA